MSWKSASDILPRIMDSAFKKQFFGVPTTCQPKGPSARATTHNTCYASRGYRSFTVTLTTQFN